MSATASGFGPRQWRDWLALARVSNLPTVWSNVLVGLALGQLAVEMAAGGAEGTQGRAPFSAFALLIHGAGVGAAISLIYIAGMVLNDVFDVAWDRVHRPERPLAAQRIGMRVAMRVAVALLAMALLLLGAIYAHRDVVVGGAVLAGTLVGAVVLYDGLHKRWRAAAALMGVCRALVYVVAAATMVPTEALLWEVAWWAVVGPMALLMGAYVTLVTWLAQRETEAHWGRRRWLALGLAVAVVVVPWPALLVVPVWGTAAAWQGAVVAGGVMSVWLVHGARAAMAQPPRMHRAVSGWLAGIALIDVWFLVLLGVPLAAVGAGACFVLSLLGQRWVAAT